MWRLTHEADLAVSGDMDPIGLLQESSGQAIGYFRKRHHEEVQATAFHLGQRCPSRRSLSHPDGHIRPQELRPTSLGQEPLHKIRHISDLKMSAVEIDREHHGGCGLQILRTRTLGACGVRSHTVISLLLVTSMATAHARTEENDSSAWFTELKPVGRPGGSRRLGQRTRVPSPFEPDFQTNESIV